jgi:hypothetical protein
MPTGQETAVVQRRAKLGRRDTLPTYPHTSAFITGFLKQELRIAVSRGRMGLVIPSETALRQEGHQAHLAPALTGPCA